ncbi:MAG: hypothetical protein A2571_03245 [Candidatus Vogelbacteria bacterium RIFOXYD1_FULL_44_32]|uniref:D-lactate dehydrogenase (cytochrome) n=1 Tax=Candidatus Vogelbacteria bacterium RIFOXYD1_FULL_44_32 TaxID=1802438 RepID=A0A1G2QCE5_9BACT|nr:MAG: hypothetical protein A2571_03245 [Candidatus Vogelbacteria bacterium RIFOXYD1_FULL_44_32]
MAISLDLQKELAKQFKGEISTDPKVLATYSHDASLFEVLPALVVWPKDEADIKALVDFVNKNKSDNPELAITVRAAGTCMSGGAIGESIVADTTKYMRGVFDLETGRATVLPGTFYRDFEVEAKKTGQMLPSYTASKDLNAIGGMIGNNSGGEKNLRYGKTEKYVETLEVVLADGETYEIKALTKFELDQQMNQDNFLGKIYREVFSLLENNKAIIEKARPRVSKNSAGYYLWNIWDGQTFNLNKLFTGAQGTLGIVTKATLKLVPIEEKSELVVVFLSDVAQVAEIVNEALVFAPDSIESYDDKTMKLALRFLPALAKKLKFGGLWKLGWSFWPEFKMAIRTGLPKLVLLVEFTGRADEDLNSKAGQFVQKMEAMGIKAHQTTGPAETEKYWTIRREAFSLLRQHLGKKRTAPFIDDIIVEPAKMPEFLPKLRAILDEYNLFYTIAGHAGDGNFHIIPLMDMRNPKNVEIIIGLSDRVYDLVISFGGSITAEHNDGIIRTPYLEKMYGPEIVRLFAELKQIFDPQNIFNPGKKVGGSKEYLKDHLARS